MAAVILSSCLKSTKTTDPAEFDLQNYQYYVFLNDLSLFVFIFCTWEQTWDRAKSNTSISSFPTLWILPRT
jgi:hypothetical protein